jgi:hypothetical protein
MKNLKKVLTSSAFLLGFSLNAQIVLQDFTAVVDNDLNYFYGTWEATGDTGGTWLPNAGFVQGIGVYDISAANSTDNSTSKLEFFNNTPVSIGSNAFIAVTAQALTSNAATSFAVILADSLGRTASAAFDLSLFPTGSFSTQVVALTFGSGFDSSAIDSLILSGNQLGGLANFRVSFDQIAAVSAIPEPATYAIIIGLIALGFVVRHRRLNRA